MVDVTYKIKEGQQQLPLEFEQSQLGSLPVRKPLMIAAAQPTPGLTFKAMKGQLPAHAPHSMHESLSTIRAFPLLIESTLWGQTWVHIPQPVHFSILSSNVATFFKYLCFIMSPLIYTVKRYS
jgi:hypothetical protein